MAGLAWGVLGGTFDPVHIGHMALAEAAREQLNLGRVIWVPAGDPWRKADRTVTAAEHRVAMVELAIRDSPRFELCMIEVERQGPSYSIDTLAELRRRAPERALYFLLGQDALFDLPAWREPAKLIEVAQLAVTTRGEARPTREALEQLVPGLAARVVWVKMPQVDVSATMLRELAAQGRSLHSLVPPGVDAYIRERGLYRGS